MQNRNMHIEYAIFLFGHFVDLKKKIKYKKASYWIILINYFLLYLFI